MQSNGLASVFRLSTPAASWPDDDAVIPVNISNKQVRDACAGFGWVVDARQGLTPLDEELAEAAARDGKRVLVAANKSESARVEATASEFYKFGFEKCFPSQP